MRPGHRGEGAALKLTDEPELTGRTTMDERARLLPWRWSADEPNAITAQHVAQAAEAGDALARAVLDEAARMLGTGLGGAINLMNPERVVLGGGVTKSGERWWRIVRETARDHVLPQIRVEIVPAALGDDAPLWGAAALAESLLDRLIDRFDSLVAWTTHGTMAQCSTRHRHSV